MRLAFWRRRPVRDPEELIALLRTAGPFATKMDRYRDFRAVFLGNSTAEQGRRVLWEMLGWARLYQTVAQKGDPHMTYYRDGQRAIALQLLAVLHAEPVAGERQTEAQKQDEG